MQFIFLSILVKDPNPHISSWSVTGAFFIFGITFIWIHKNVKTMYGNLWFCVFICLLAP